MFPVQPGDFTKGLLRLESHLKQVNHPGHLGVNEDAVTLGLESSQESIQHMQLPGISHHGLLIWNEAYKMNLTTLSGGWHSHAWGNQGNKRIAQCFIVAGSPTIMKELNTKANTDKGPASVMAIPGSSKTGFCPRLTRVRGRVWYPGAKLVALGCKIRSDSGYVNGKLVAWIGLDTTMLGYQTSISLSYPGASIAIIAEKNEYLESKGRSCLGLWKQANPIQAINHNAGFPATDTVDCCS